MVQNKGGLINVISTLLDSVPPVERDNVVRAAMARSQGDRRAVPAFWAGIPGRSSSKEVAAKSTVGIANLLTALSSAPSPQMTIKQLLALSESISSGRPLEGDPMEEGTAGLPTMATAVMGMGMKNPDAARALEESPEVMKVLETISEIYDAEEYHGVLGGDPLQGGFLSDLWKNITKSADKVKKVDENVKEVAKVISSPVSTVHTLKADEDAEIVPDVADSSKELQSAVQLSSDAAKAQVEKLTKALNQMKDQKEQSQLDAEQAAREFGKISWASAFLSAPDSVAELLSKVDPKTQDMKSFMESIWGTIGAARESGDISKLTALTDSLKVMLGQKKISQNSMAALLTGDPTPGEDSSILEGDPDLLDIINQQSPDEDVRE